MSLRSQVRRLILLPVLAVGIAVSALGVESPFAKFKTIVALSEADREAAIQELKVSSERHRKVVRAKVSEYASMSETERNRKLDALDFRWHLLPLMKLDATKRTQRLASVPERFREDINQRLARWDKLEGGTREELLKNESFFRYMSSFGRGRESRIAMTNHIGRMPPKLREGVEKRIADWRGKPKPDRRKMSRQFHRFFDLRHSEQEKALSHLPRRERAKMEASLERFRAMSTAQRELVIKSFDRLADMTQDERTSFFRNSQRWNEMGDTERKQWRTLVTKMPPLPPGFEKKATPPLPPGMGDPAAGGQTVVTNSLR